MLIAAGVLIGGWAGHPGKDSRLAFAVGLAVVAVAAVGIGLILFNNPVDPQRSATTFRLRRRNERGPLGGDAGPCLFRGRRARPPARDMVGTAQDITERKEREEKEYLLMREINHRAKDRLSVVGSIAHHTASKNPEDFVECFSERIQALSANQDLLVRNVWNGVEIEDLMRAQLAHFTGLIGSRIAVFGPGLRVTAASAQAIRLALHELATNAGNTGRSRRTGVVSISPGAPTAAP